MLKTPLFSIIVPIYNAEKYLAPCIKSILAQSITNFELLLVNDGSTDNSGEICEEYASKDSRVHVFHKPNGGVSSARNLGIREAHGEWITFCDSDDLVYPNWLNNYILEENTNIDLIQQSVIADQNIFQGKMCPEYGYINKCKPLDFIKIMHECNALGYVWIKAFRKSILTANGIHFNENIVYKEDELFVLDYLPHCRLCKIVQRNGYQYFVPDFKKKYACVDESYYYEHFISSLNSLHINKTDSLIRSFRDKHICILMQKFPLHPQIQYLRTIRKYHLNDYNTSKLNKHIRTILTKDSSLICSWIVFYVYSIIRKLYYSFK